MLTPKQRKWLKISLKEAEILTTMKEYLKAKEVLLSAISNVQEIKEDYFLPISLQLVAIDNASDLEVEKASVVEEGVFVKVQDLQEWIYMGVGSPLDAIHLEQKEDDRYKQLIGKSIGDLDREGCIKLYLHKSCL